MHANTMSNRVRNITIGAIAALLVILGLTAGGNTDNAVNGSGSSSVSVSDGSTVTTDLGQPVIEETAVYPLKLKYIGSQNSQGYYVYFQTGPGQSKTFINPYNYSFTINACYTVSYMAGSGLYNKITDRTKIAC